MKPKIIIVDDHQTFRQGLKNLIEGENMGKVIGEAADGVEFLDLLTTHKPDLILMDIDMNQMNGVETTRKALQMTPNLKVIALTMFENEEYLYKMIDVGATGFLLKSSHINELEKAIKLVVNGEKHFSFSLPGRNMINFGR
jgi:DNA-binding NarL/FixJ family response regulator